MTVLLKTLMDMSVQASCMILAVIVVRYVLRNQSKKFRPVLWAVVAFRLICPFRFEVPYAFRLQENIITGSGTVNRMTEYSVMNKSIAAVVSVMRPIRLLLP